MGDLQGPEVDHLQEESSAGCPGAPTCQPDHQVPKVHRAFRASSDKINAELEAEVVHLEEACSRLSRLETQAAVLPPDATPPPDPIGEVQKLQAMVTQLQVEKEELVRLANTSSCERSRVRAEHIPIMPNFIPAELAHWMDDRQAELQEAFSIGDDQAVLELSSKMAQGAERMVQMKRLVPDDELASAPGEGRLAPY